MRIKSRIFVLFFVLILTFQFEFAPTATVLSEEAVTYDKSLFSLTILEVTDTTVEMFWVSNDMDHIISEYEVYRDNEKITTTNSLAYTDVSLVPETSYTYQVKAKDINGNIIAESNIIEISTTVSKAIMQLTLRASDITDTLVQLNWTFPTNEQVVTGDALSIIQKPVEYKVFKNEECINITNDTSFSVDNLTPETEYLFRVTATLSSDNGSYMSNTLIIKTLPSKDFIKGELGYETTRFIIKIKNKQDSEKLERALKEKNVKSKMQHNNESKNFLTVSLNGKVKLDDFVKELKDKKLDNDIEYIQPDYEFVLTSDDPYYATQWGLENDQTGAAEDSDISIEQRIEMLPPHLRNIIDSSVEFKELLLNASFDEIQEKIKTGNTPGDIQPENLLEIINDPAFREIYNRGENGNLPIFLCDAGISGAWNITTGNGVIVGVIDTGIDITHEDLAENIWVNTGEIPDNNMDDDGNGYIDDYYGWNFAEDSNQVYDNYYSSYENHGTHIAGTISAQKDNGMGIAGVAPSAEILPLKVFQGGKAYTSDIIDAIKYAERCGVKIVNCSWGSTDGNPALFEAIQDSGMLFVCAAGNSSGNIDTSPIYPASFDCPNIITTSSVNQYGILSGFSNYGENSVDVAAPGDNIESTMPGNMYGILSGTSMAAAFVSGEAALLLSESGSMSIADLKERIINTGDRLSSLMGKVNESIKINCTNAINNVSNSEMIYVPVNDQMHSGNLIEENQDDYNLYIAPAFQGQLIKIACGQDYSIALRTDGTVWTCGYNYSGQLGDGSTVNRTTPVQVSGLTGITAITAGNYHGMALKSDGTVWAWGYNGEGQLGDGTQTKKLIPVQVSGLNGIIAISGGDSHSLALKNDGTVWVWGGNNYGQLGDGTSIDRMTPIQINSLSGVIAIAGGSYHSIALKSDGTVWAWGYNLYGQLGDATTVNKNIPVQVSGLSQISDIKGGSNHSLALKNDGTVWAWGYNYYGQLGDGTKIVRKTPVQVSGLAGITAIAGGANHSLALKNDGTLWAWGFNYYNQLGDGTAVSKRLPVQVSGLSGITAVAGGENHSIALKNDGTLWAWGYNSYGQLGNGTEIKRATAVKVSSINEIALIAAGEHHNLALKNDGTVWAWGYNYSGQLGDGSEVHKLTPVQVNGLSGITAITAGSSNSLALKNDRTVWAWGGNIYGQLGDGTQVDKTTPVQVGGLSGITAIAGGGDHSLVLKNDGTVWAWGENNYGQIGDGTQVNKTTPVQVNALSGITAIAGGSDHSIALKNDGTVWAWGYNGSYQLGDGTQINRTTPVQVIGLSGVIAIAGGNRHSIALKNDGTVWTWGDNYWGQLGDGTTITRTTPVQVSGLSGVVSITGGYINSTALKDNGTIWEWGNNGFGQLGDGTTVTRLTPVQVNDLSGITDIAAGMYHSIALMVNGSAYAWGSNAYGQLGNGEEVRFTIPRWSFGTPQGLSLTYDLVCTINKEFNLVVKANNIQSFEGRTYTVIYNTSEVVVADPCSMTYKKEVETGTIQGTGITIVQMEPGVIKFTVNRPIAQGKTWSGVVNVITFIPITSGTTTVQCLIQ